MTKAPEKETLGFQTEARQLLDLMIHSLYSNKEIFLRELISNGSDAADRLRFEALTNDGLYEGDGDLKIRVNIDKKARTITVTDNGVGMGYQEVIDNLGTIAKSGTKQFFAALTGDQAKDAQLIGQFGVGFYSSFIVADRVTVTTRRAGLGSEGGVRWESTGEGEYTIERIDRAQRGTEVTLHLREDQDEFLEGYRLRGIIRRYSDHISLPILMPKEQGDSDSDDEGEDEGEDTVNSATALWSRSKSEVTEEEYHEFYKHVAHDFEDPLAYVHSRVEGNIEYASLLFVPARAPYDLWDRNVRRGVNLYVRRVFIMDDAEQLMPAYLRFVRGVVDSADLPLNISREILQKNKQIDAIRAGSVKKILDLLRKLAKNDSDKYAKFWGEFGKVMKEGVIDDAKNKDQVAKLLRFATTSTEPDTQSVALEDYVGRMKEGQEKIYYVTADSDATARNSPHLEIFKKKDIEVLLLTEEIDEWFVHHLNDFEGHALHAVSKGELDLGDIDGEEAESKAEDSDDTHAALLSAFRDGLGERIKDVRITHRLTSSPACLVADEHEMGAHLERILKSAGQQVTTAKPILEINPDHPMIQRLSKEADSARQKDWAAILLEQAMLSEGGKLDDPAGFVRKLNEMFLAMISDGPAAAPAKPKAKKATKKKRVTKKTAAKAKKSEAG